MKKYNLAFILLTGLLTQPDRTLSETGETERSTGPSGAGFGMAELSGGGMIAIIVLGIFGVALLAVICCASWSMVMTCCELRADRDKTNGKAESLEEPQKLPFEEKTLFPPSVFHHPLTSDGPIESVESVV